MRTWHVAPVPLRCGRCGTEIPKGARYEAIQFHPAIRRPKQRCRECAETPEPAVIGPRSSDPDPIRSWEVMSRLVKSEMPRLVPREPGCDDE